MQATVCNSDIVTYDLAIAKVAKQIQSEESPQFDDVFVMFGAFHIMLNIFSSTRKIIEGSGGPYALSESKIVAPGSINKFLKGKMYNRCKRGHNLLWAAVHGLHLERFIEDLNVKEDFINELDKIAVNGPVSGDDIPKMLKHLITQYEFYCNDTLTGERGKTAQFWMQYAHIIELSNILHRAIKENDPELFAYALFELSPIFFMTNHHNYARWMVLYALELANLDPELYNMLINGGFSVNRTGRPFAEVAVDMPLEQTISTEAKNRLKGIMKYADVSTAVNRWSITHSMKTELVNSLLDIAGFSETKYNHKETKESRKRHDNNRDLKNLKDRIKETMNPFNKQLNKQHLFNIKTGRKVNEDAESYLLQIFSTGIQKRDEFIEKCKEDAKKFEEPIKKTKVVNFATESISKSNKSRKVAEIVTLKGTRDLFGRLLFLTVTHQIDIKKLFEYPLVPEPPCFCHPDGSMYQSEKATVLDFLVKNHDTATPNPVRTVIVDGMFLIKSTINQCCPTFSAFARTMLMKVLKLTEHRVDICFDVYESPSIKDVKRKDRGNEETERISYIWSSTEVTN